MTDRRACIKRWRGKDAALESYPIHRGRWPDDDHIGILQRLCTGHVCEVGCGTGRCADAFETYQYTGVDINKAAIEVARVEKPDHLFCEVSWDDMYPLADTYLFHTCMMHIPGEELPSVLERVTGRIVIADWMEPRLHNPRGCIWQRSADEYTTALRMAGFTDIAFEEHDTNYQLSAHSTFKLKRRFITGQSGGGDGDSETDRVPSRPDQ